MCIFESSQKDESRAQSVDSSNAYKKLVLLNYFGGSFYYVFYITLRHFYLCRIWTFPVRLNAFSFTNNIMSYVYRCKSKQILGGTKDILPEFPPNLPDIFLCCNLSYTVGWILSTDELS